MWLTMSKRLERRLYYNWLSFFAVIDANVPIADLDRGQLENTLKIVSKKCRLHSVYAFYN